MKQLIPSLLIIFSCFFSNSILAQKSNVIDSLENVLKNSKEDTARINALNLIAWETSKNDPLKAKEYALQALGMTEKLSYENKNASYIKQKLIADSYHQLAWADYVNGDYSGSLEYNLKALYKRDSLKYKKGIASSLNNIGNIYRIQGDYSNSLEYYLKALSLFQEAGDKIRTATALGNIGLVYYNKGNFSTSLDYYFRAMKMDEESGNKSGVARHLGNIGIVYKDEGDNSRALDYYFKALKMDEELGNKNGVATHLGDIGIVYMHQSDYSKALEYYFKALKINKESGNQKGVANQISNIGVVYGEQKDYLNALDYFFKALKMEESFGDKTEIAVKYINIGSLYILMKKYKEAEQYLDKGLALSKEIGARHVIKDAYDFRMSLDPVQGKYKDMMNHYKLYISYRDSLHNEENTKKIVQSQMQYEFDRKETLAKAEQEKKEAISKEELQKQTLLRNGIIVSTVLLILLSLLFFNRYQLRKKLEKQEAILKERKRISADLHDDLSSGLTSIRMLSEIAGNKSPQKIAEIDKISRSSETLMENMREIIWAMSAENNTLEDLVFYIRKYAGEFLDICSIEYLFNIPEFIPDVILSAEKKRNMFLAVKESLHNIAKHAGASLVTLRFNFDEDIQITITDNGKGIDLKGLNGAGHGLKNMKSRMEIINGTFKIENKIGTTVELCCPMTEKV